jgi:hypothetical protein
LKAFLDWLRPSGSQPAGRCPIQVEKRRTLNRK